VTAARVPKLGLVDVFAPEVVVSSYEGYAEHTIRALLDLVHPQHPDAPTSIYPAPPSLRIPRHRQRPMSIQLPSAEPGWSPRSPLDRSARSDVISATWRMKNRTAPGARRRRDQFSCSRAQQQGSQSLINKPCC